MVAIGITGATGLVGRELMRQWACCADVQPRLYGRSGGGAAGAVVHPLPTSPDDLRGLDVVVHLAGSTDLRAPEADLMAANADLATTVARLAAREKVTRFVLVSSMSVHGRTVPHAVTPDTPYAPTNAYGRSKVAAETAVGAVCRETGLELAIVRPPMIYGAGSQGSFNALRRLVIMGAPLPFGLSRARRSFCSVANAASAVDRAARAEVQGVLLPADPEDVSLPELVRGIAAAAGRRPLLLLPAPPALMKAALGAVGKSEMASSLFEPLTIDRAHWPAWGWAPPQSNADGVRAAVAA